MECKKVLLLKKLSAVVKTDVFHKSQEVKVITGCRRQFADLKEGGKQGRMEGRKDK